MSSAATDGAPPTVIVVGSINMDLVFTGLPRLPLPGETTSSGEFGLHPGGKGANQAAAAARLGAFVHLIAAIGDDDFGRLALSDLAAHHVDTSLVRLVGAATGVAAVLIEESGENSIVVNPGANAELRASDARSDAASISAEHATLLLSLEVPIDVVSAWAQVGAERGWTVVLNPAPYPPGALPTALIELCDVLTPNAGEYARMIEQDGASQRVDVSATIVVTKGSAGAEVRVRGQVLTPVASFPVDAVDTTGAGDAFSGAFAVATARGLGAAEAAEFASAAGALATRAVGARGSLPTASDVLNLIARSGDGS